MSHFANLGDGGGGGGGLLKGDNVTPLFTVFFYRGPSLNCEYGKCPHGWNKFVFDSGWFSDIKAEVCI